MRAEENRGAPKLYLVHADKADYDDFLAAVVYAESPLDAVEIAVGECYRASLVPTGATGEYRASLSPAAGAWSPPMDGAVLTATEVPVARGAVLGHAKPC